MLAETSNRIELAYLTREQAQDIATKYGTPVYVYDEAALRAQAAKALAFRAPYGLTVRYAMKANPLAAILELFRSLGLHIDASSEPEVYRAIKAGLEPQRIMLTSQQLPKDLRKLVQLGVKFNACSLHQLEAYGRHFPGGQVSVRFNVGLGSGHSRSVSVAGPTSSFGIWHERADQVEQLLSRYNLKLSTIHSHIGCGADPDIWTAASKLTLELINRFPSVESVNLGGGFKVARMPNEQTTDLAKVSAQISRLITDFHTNTGRQLKLEIEPGTMLVANAGTLVTTVQDIVSTGGTGYTFLKLDTGMNDILRPCLHGSQHPIVVLSSQDATRDYVVVGHNCESTDLLTPTPDDAEVPQPRLLPEASIGDIVAIEGVGAYCSSMRAIGYNSFSTPNEVILTSDKHVKLINRSLTVEDFTSSEVYE